MVVVASMIGVQGLGQPVLKAIANQYFTLGIFNGLAIVGIAIIFDRVSQAYGKRLQKHREIVHDRFRGGRIAFPTRAAKRHEHVQLGIISRYASPRNIIGHKAEILCDTLDAVIMQSLSVTPPEVVLSRTRRSSC